MRIQGVAGLLPLPSDFIAVAASNDTITDVGLGALTGLRKEGFANLLLLSGVSLIAATVTYVQTYDHEGSLDQKIASAAKVLGMGVITWQVCSMTAQVGEAMVQDLADIAGIENDRWLRVLGALIGAVKGLEISAAIPRVVLPRAVELINAGRVRLAGLLPRIPM